MERAFIESIDSSMSELYRMHDYRGMYEFYKKIIKPALAKGSIEAGNCNISTYCITFYTYKTNIKPTP